LFPVTDTSPRDDGSDDDEREWCLTPRTADALHAALGYLADSAYDDIESHGDEEVTVKDGTWSLFDQLPRISWRQPASWRRAVARAADDLADDLERGKSPIPRCNAEELMLHLAIRTADESVSDGVVTGEDLPKHGDDYDWRMCVEDLFQDHDILLLDQSWADGIEDPTGELNQQLAMGDLRPGSWLTTFNNCEPRDPDREFRR
jgi:hypothetical protein